MNKIKRNDKDIFKSSMVAAQTSALSIAVMMFVGIWFPARKAMKVEPAVALHGE